MTDMDPKVGNWYKDLEGGGLFEVVAVDEDAGTIEIQFFDGDIEEIETDTWYEMVMEAAEPPEDWSGPFDDIEPDDLGYSDRVRDGHEREDPLTRLD